MPIQMEGGKKRKTTPPKKPPSIDLTTESYKILDDPFPLVFERSVLKSEPPPNDPRYSTTLDISYMAQDYAKQMLTIMNDLRKVKKFCNVVLTVNHTEILAHKSILAASSTFFRAMFDNKQAEGPSATVNISGITETIVRQLVEFAYTGNITVGKGNVKEMLQGAGSLKFLPVRDACTDFLERHISPANSVGIRYFALLENCSDLVQKAEDFIARNFTDVAKSEEFFMLTSSQVTELLNLQIYPFRNEQAIAIAVFCWINHNTEGRKQCFKALFEQIKLEMLPAPFIMSNLVHNEMVNECQESKEAVLLTVAKLKLLSEDVSKVTLDSVLASEPTIVQPVPLLPVATKRSTASPSRKRGTNQLTSPHNKLNLDNGSAFKRKTPTKSPTTVAEVTSAEPTAESKSKKPGDSNSKMLVKEGTAARESSDLGSQRDIQVSPRDTKGTYHGDTKGRGSQRIVHRDTNKGDKKMGDKFVRCPGHAMFVVGGACNVNMADAINKVEYYSPAQDEWFEAGPLKKSRSLVGVTVLRGTLYAVGGFDGISPIDSVECYNQGTNSWSCTGRMISARRGAGVTTLNNKIYAVGGYDGTKLLSLSEVYHDNTNSWEPIAPLQTCRFALGAASLDNKVFAVGGFDGHSHLSTVEMYDPYSNTWKHVAPMSMSRYAVGVTALNNTIYAVGGLDGTRPLATVERYDPRIDKWSAVCDMDTQRAGVDATVLDNDLYSAGGILGSSPLQTVEKLDIRANKWIYVNKMSIPRVDAGAGSIMII